MQALLAKQLVQALLQSAFKAFFDRWLRRLLAAGLKWTCGLAASRGSTKLIVQETTQLVLEFALKLVDFAADFVAEFALILLKLRIQLVRDGIVERTRSRIFHQISRESANFVLVNNRSRCSTSNRN